MNETKPWSPPRGRPSIYKPILRRIKEVGSVGEWFDVRQHHANRTAPSQLRKRYPEFDFRAVPDEAHNAYTIQAAWLGDERRQA
jgi:hypothetical protein